MPDTPPLSPAYTKTEAAYRFRCSEKTVERWIRDGELEGHRVGKRLLIPAWSVERLLAGKTTPKAGRP